MSEPGLRERKKQKTRWAIQEHALRLFAEQGYDATTVDQIAAAAEISPSTFFRYYKTKEDVVVQDEYDPIFEELIRVGEPDQPPLTAIRNVVRSVLSSLPAEENRKIVERGKLILAVPALRGRSMENLLATNDLLVRALAERLHRTPADFEIRVLAGALTGSMISVAEQWIAGDGQEDFAELIDRALVCLESGFASLSR